MGILIRENNNLISIEAYKSGYYSDVKDLISGKEVGGLRLFVKSATEDVIYESTDIEREVCEDIVRNISKTGYADLSTIRVYPVNHFNDLDAKDAEALKDNTVRMVNDIQKCTRCGADTLSSGECPNPLCSNGISTHSMRQNIIQSIKNSTVELDMSKYVGTYGVSLYDVAKVTLSNKQVTTFEDIFNLIYNNRTMDKIIYVDKQPIIYVQGITVVAVATYVNATSLDRFIKDKLKVKPKPRTGRIREKYPYS